MTLKAKSHYKALRGIFLCRKPFDLRLHTKGSAGPFVMQVVFVQRQDKCIMLSSAAGDVYRRDSIDQSHYPVFHQMEGDALSGPVISFAR